MHEFEQYIFKKIRDVMLGWNTQTTSDIYALSFFINDENDDPRNPTLTFGYNTVSHWQKSIESAYDKAEAKWNYAFWLQNEEQVIGSSYIDNNKEDLMQRMDWIKSLDLWYSDQNEEEDFEHAMEKGAKITQQFVNICVRVAKRIHDEAVNFDVFGKTVPIIVHELEYYDAIADQTERANPPGGADEFVLWVHSM